MSFPSGSGRSGRGSLAPPPGSAASKRRDSAFERYMAETNPFGLATQSSARSGGTGLSQATFEDSSSEDESSEEEEILSTSAGVAGGSSSSASFSAGKSGIGDSTDVSSSSAVRGVRRGQSRPRQLRLVDVLGELMDRAVGDPSAAEVSRALSAVKAMHEQREEKLLLLSREINGEEFSEWNCYRSDNKLDSVLVLRGKVRNPEEVRKKWTYERDGRKMEQTFHRLLGKDPMAYRGLVELNYRFPHMLESGNPFSTEIVPRVSNFYFFGYLHSSMTWRNHQRNEDALARVMWDYCSRIIIDSPLLKRYTWNPAIDGRLISNHRMPFEKSLQIWMRLRNGASPMIIFENCGFIGLSGEGTRRRILKALETAGFVDMSDVKLMDDCLTFEKIVFSTLLNPRWAEFHLDSIWQARWASDSRQFIIELLMSRDLFMTVWGFSLAKSWFLLHYYYCEDVKVAALCAKYAPKHPGSCFEFRPFYVEQSARPTTHRRVYGRRADGMSIPIQGRLNERAFQQCMFYNYFHHPIERNFNELRLRYNTPYEEQIDRLIEKTCKPGILPALKQSFEETVGNQFQRFEIAECDDIDKVYRKTERFHRDATDAQRVHTPSLPDWWFPQHSDWREYRGFTDGNNVRLYGVKCSSLARKEERDSMNQALLLFHKALSIGEQARFFHLNDLDYLDGEEKGWLFADSILADIDLSLEEFEEMKHTERKLYQQRLEEAKMSGRDESMIPDRPPEDDDGWRWTKEHVWKKYSKKGRTPWSQRRQKLPKQWITSLGFVVDVPSFSTPEVLAPWMRYIICTHPFFRGVRHPCLNLLTDLEILAVLTGDVPVFTMLFIALRRMREAIHKQQKSSDYYSFYHTAKMNVGEINRQNNVLIPDLDCCMYAAREWEFIRWLNANGRQFKKQYSESADFESNAGFLVRFRHGYAFKLDEKLSRMLRLFIARPIKERESSHQQQVITACMKLLQGWLRRINRDVIRECKTTSSLTLTEWLKIKLPRVSQDRYSDGRSDGKRLKEFSFVSSLIEECCKQRCMLVRMLKHPELQWSLYEIDGTKALSKAGAADGSGSGSGIGDSKSSGGLRGRMSANLYGFRSTTVETMAVAKQTLTFDRENGDYLHYLLERRLDRVALNKFSDCEGIYELTRHSTLLFGLSRNFLNLQSTQIFIPEFAVAQRDIPELIYHYVLRKELRRNVSSPLTCADLSLAAEELFMFLVTPPFLPLNNMVGTKSRLSVALTLSRSAGSSGSDSFDGGSVRDDELASVDYTWDKVERRLFEKLTKIRTDNIVSSKGQHLRNDLDRGVISQEWFNVFAPGRVDGSTNAMRTPIDEPARGDPTLKLAWDADGVCDTWEYKDMCQALFVDPVPYIQHMSGFRRARFLTYRRIDRRATDDGKEGSSASMRRGDKYADVDGAVLDDTWELNCLLSMGAATVIPYPSNEKNEVNWSYLRLFSEWRREFLVDSLIKYWVQTGLPVDSARMIPNPRKLEDFPIFYHLGNVYSEFVENHPDSVKFEEVAGRVIGKPEIELFDGNVLRAEMFFGSLEFFKWFTRVFRQMDAESMCFDSLYSTNSSRRQTNLRELWQSMMESFVRRNALLVCDPWSRFPVVSLFKDDSEEDLDLTQLPWLNMPVYDLNATWESFHIAYVTGLNAAAKRMSRKMDAHRGDHPTVQTGCNGSTMNPERDLAESEGYETSVLNLRSFERNLDFPVCREDFSDDQVKTVDLTGTPLEDDGGLCLFYDWMQEISHTWDYLPYYASKLGELALPKTALSSVLSSVDSSGQASKQSFSTIKNDSNILSVELDKLLSASNVDLIVPNLKRHPLWDTQPKLYHSIRAVRDIDPTYPWLCLRPRVWQSTFLYPTFDERHSAVRLGATKSMMEGQMASRALQILEKLMSDDSNKKTDPWDLFTEMQAKLLGVSDCLNVPCNSGATEGGRDGPRLNAFKFGKINSHSERRIDKVRMYWHTQGLEWFMNKEEGIASQTRVFSRPLMEHTGCWVYAGLLRCVFALLDFLILCNSAEFNLDLKLGFSERQHRDDEARNHLPRRDASSAGDPIKLRDFNRRIPKIARRYCFEGWIQRYIEMFNVDGSTLCNGNSEDFNEMFTPDVSMYDDLYANDEHIRDEVKNTIDLLGNDTSMWPTFFPTNGPSKIDMIMKEWHRILPHPSKSFRQKVGQSAKQRRERMTSECSSDARNARFIVNEVSLLFGWLRHICSHFLFQMMPGYSDSSASGASDMGSSSSSSKDPSSSAAGGGTRRRSLRPKQGMQDGSVPVPGMTDSTMDSTAGLLLSDKYAKLREKLTEFGNLLFAFNKAWCILPSHCTLTCWDEWYDERYGMKIPHSLMDARRYLFAESKNADKSGLKWVLSQRKRFVNFLSIIIGDWVLHEYTFNTNISTELAGNPFEDFWEFIGFFRPLDKPPRVQHLMEILQCKRLPYKSRDETGREVIEDKAEDWSLSFDHWWLAPQQSEHPEIVESFMDSLFEQSGFALSVDSLSDYLMNDYTEFSTEFTNALCKEMVHFYYLRNSYLMIRNFAERLLVRRSDQRYRADGMPFSMNEKLMSRVTFHELIQEWVKHASYCSESIIWVHLRSPYMDDFFKFGNLYGLHDELAMVCNLLTNTFGGPVTTLVNSDYGAVFLNSLSASVTRHIATRNPGPYSALFTQILCEDQLLKSEALVRELSDDHWMCQKFNVSNHYHRYTSAKTRYKFWVRILQDRDGITPSDAMAMTGAAASSSSSSSGIGGLSVTAPHGKLATISSQKSLKLSTTRLTASASISSLTPPPGPEDLRLPLCTSHLLRTLYAYGFCDSQALIEPNRSFINFVMSSVMSEERREKSSWITGLTFDLLQTDTPGTPIWMTTSFPVECSKLIASLFIQPSLSNAIMCEFPSMRHWIISSERFLTQFKNDLIEDMNEEQYRDRHNILHTKEKVVMSSHLIWRHWTWIELFSRVSSSSENLGKLSLNNRILFDYLLSLRKQWMKTVALIDSRSTVSFEQVIKLMDQGVSSVAASAAAAPTSSSLASSASLKISLTMPGMTDIPSDPLTALSTLGRRRPFWFRAKEYLTGKHGADFSRRELHTYLGDSVEKCAEYLSLCDFPTLTALFNLKRSRFYRRKIGGQSEVEVYNDVNFDNVGAPKMFNFGFPFTQSEPLKIRPIRSVTKWEDQSRPQMIKLLIEFSRREHNEEEHGLIGRLRTRQKALQYLTYADPRMSNAGAGQSGSMSGGSNAKKSGVSGITDSSPSAGGAGPAGLTGKEEILGALSDLSQEQRDTLLLEYLTSVGMTMESADTVADLRRAADVKNELEAQLQKRDATSKDFMKKFFPHRAREENIPLKTLAEKIQYALNGRGKMPDITDEEIQAFYENLGTSHGSQHVFAKIAKKLTDQKMARDSDESAESFDDDEEEYDDEHLAGGSSDEDRPPDFGTGLKHEDSFMDGRKRRRSEHMDDDGGGKSAARVAALEAKTKKEAAKRVKSAQKQREKEMKTRPPNREMDSSDAAQLMDREKGISGETLATMDVDSSMAGTVFAQQSSTDPKIAAGIQRYSQDVPAATNPDPDAYKPKPTPLIDMLNLDSKEVVVRFQYGSLLKMKERDMGLIIDDDRLVSDAVALDARHLDMNYMTHTDSLPFPQLRLKYNPYNNRLEMPDTLASGAVQFSKVGSAAASQSNLLGMQVGGTSTVGAFGPVYTKHDRTGSVLGGLGLESTTSKDTHQTFGFDDTTIGLDTPRTVHEDGKHLVMSSTTKRMTTRFLHSLITGKSRVRDFFKRNPETKAEFWANDMTEQLKRAYARLIEDHNLAQGKDIGQFTGPYPNPDEMRAAVLRPLKIDRANHMKTFQYFALRSKVKKSMLDDSSSMLTPGMTTKSGKKDAEDTEQEITVRFTQEELAGPMIECLLSLINAISKQQTHIKLEAEFIAERERRMTVDFQKVMNEIRTTKVKNDSLKDETEYLKSLSLHKRDRLRTYKSTETEKGEAMEHAKNEAAERARQKREELSIMRQEMSVERQKYRSIEEMIVEIRTSIKRKHSELHRRQMEIYQRRDDSRESRDMCKKYDKQIEICQKRIYEMSEIFAPKTQELRTIVKNYAQVLQHKQRVSQVVREKLVYVMDLEKRLTLLLDDFRKNTSPATLSQVAVFRNKRRELKEMRKKIQHATPVFLLQTLRKPTLELLIEESLKSGFLNNKQGKLEYDIQQKQFTLELISNENRTNNIIMADMDELFANSDIDELIDYSSDEDDAKEEAGHRDSVAMPDSDERKYDDSGAPAEGAESKMLLSRPSISTAAATDRI